MFFHFKQFSIRQRDSAMKVGTDGLLLATSTPLASNKSSLSVLDIGCGTGLISLIIAQREPMAEITAIEIDQAAADEAKFNFDSSPFSDRLKIENSSLKDYSSISTKTFDLIICNPPFFDGSQAVGSRKQARNSATLPPNDLFEGASKLLDPNGQFSMIIPFQNEKTIIEAATKAGLYPFELLRIRGRRASKIIRSIIHFKKCKAEPEMSEMSIELDQRHQYSGEYIELTKDFLTIFD